MKTSFCTSRAKNWCDKEKRTSDAHQNYGPKGLFVAIFPNQKPRGHTVSLVGPHTALSQNLCEKLQDSELLNYGGTKETGSPHK